MSGLLTIAAVLLFYLIRRKKLEESLWLRRVEGPGLLAGAALAPALYLGITLAMMALPEAWMDSYAEASAGVGDGGVGGVIAVVLVAPVVEEFIFRGLMMTRLARAMPGWLAAALSAAVFGACHGHPVWFAYAFALGVVFGLMDLRLGSIWPSILAHLVFNAIGQVFSLLPEDDGVVMGAYLALLAVYLIPLCVIAVYPLIFSRFGDVYLLTSYGSILAFFLMGAALIALGVFISSLTDNQGFAAGIGIAVILLNYYSVSLSEYVSSTVFGSVVALCVLVLALGAVIKYLTKNENLAYAVCFVLIAAIVIVAFMDNTKFEGLLPAVMTRLSLFDRFTGFVNGVFDMTSVVYYASVAVFFLFLSVQSLEKRRYN